jgi:hypothetical protein
MTTINEIAYFVREHIENGSIQYGSSFYMTAEDVNGDDVKIRVSNHSANRQNNSGKTLSFITERTRQNKSAYNQMIDEYVVMDNGLCDTYESIEEILSYELVY